MCSQTSAVKIEDVSEPPELTGEPKKFTEPTQADRQLFEIVNHLKDIEETKSTLPTLNKFIEQHPENSDAYFLRATQPEARRCGAGPRFLRFYNFTQIFHVGNIINNLLTITKAVTANIFNHAR
jgi:hypothetical protein